VIAGSEEPAIEAPMSITRYQQSKGKKIAAFLLRCQRMSSLSRAELVRVTAHMSNEQWRTVSLSAGVPVADLAAKIATLHCLRKRAPHVAKRVP
jgi:hypothetical protein